MIDKVDIMAVTERSHKAERERVGGARRMWSRCDACGSNAPDVVGPILLGQMRWRTFGIDGVYHGRAWDADVLLCPPCAKRMEAFVHSGGVNGRGPHPPTIKTSEGGFYVEPVWARRASN